MLELYLFDLKKICLSRGSQMSWIWSWLLEFIGLAKLYRILGISWESEDSPLAQDVEPMLDEK